MTRTTKITTATNIGLVLPMLAAFGGSVGPEPARNPIGELLSIVYRPYFMIFCEPLGVIGFVIAIVVHSLVFGAVAWLVTSGRKT